MLIHYLSFRRTALMLTILAIGFIGSATIVGAHRGDHLATPEVLTCMAQADSDSAPGGQILYIDWSETDAAGNEIQAGKWSVNLHARYDTDGDNFVDRTEEFPLGTSGRVDDRPMESSDLDIPFSELILFADTDGDGTPDQEVEPSQASVKVKGLNPTNGPQDNEFSEAYSCTL